jgi:Icc-related predicted phosphoesterase
VTRVLFTCDIHASEIVLKKAIKAVSSYNADVLIIGGDLTGKAVVPFVKQDSNLWFCNPFGKVEYLKSREDLERRMQDFRNRGYYCFETTMDRVLELQKSPEKFNELFIHLAVETIKKWDEMIEATVPKNIKVIISPGNDDPFEIDEVLKKSERIVYPEGRVVDIDDHHQMISLGWSAPTPWKTYRECSEEKLREMLETEFKKVQSYDNLVCNFHDPPYGTALDVAPQLDENFKPVTTFGQVKMIHVGSRAVHDVVMKYQPLLGLHGHIHESGSHCFLGRTLCLNPGSDYQKGAFKAYLIKLNRAQAKVDFWKIEA